MCPIAARAWESTVAPPAGASIGGGSTVLTADNSINEAFYNMKAGEVSAKPESVNLTDGSVDLRGFTDTVKLYAR